MDKKVWTKPEVSVVEFEANEYVSACGSVTTTTYSATCWDPNSTLQNSTEPLLFADSNSDKNFTFGTNSYDPARTASSAECISQNITNYSGNSSSTYTYDYAVANLGFQGMAFEEFDTGKHDFDETSYNNLNYGFVIRAQDDVNQMYEEAIHVKYWFDTAASRFHIFKTQDVLTSSLTSKNLS